MGFTSLAWLGALATLSIPLAIHLWSRRRVTTVSIGSIRFLQAVKPISRRTIRLRRPWRLLMRLGLLASLILALAGTYVELPPAEPPPERWLLVGPVAVDDGNALSLIDSLTGLADGVVTFDGDPWSAITAVDAELPDGSGITVVASTRAVRGPRPVTRSAVQWFPIEPDSGPSENIAPLHAAGSFAIMAAPNRLDDGRYLAAALVALAGEDHPAPVPILDAGQDSVPQASWIAWLSDHTPPASLLAAVSQGTTLLTDAADQGHQVSTTIPLTQFSTRQPVSLTRRGPAPPGIPWWRDGDGTVLLTADRVGDGVHYRLATRFHPDWTDLVFGGGLPEVLAPLAGLSLQEPTSPLSANQMIPTRDTTGIVARQAGPYRSLFMPLWILAALLFGIDVILMRIARKNQS